jgi:hypothetical protein
MIFKFTVHCCTHRKNYLTKVTEQVVNIRHNNTKENKGDEKRVMGYKILLSIVETRNRNLSIVFKITNL